MIEFYTNEELIGELMKRRTFVGVVISANDFRTAGDDDARFRVYGNGLLEDEAKGLLSSILEHM